MKDETFHELADLALVGSGQSIQASKSYLMANRLAPILRREGFGSLDDLVYCLKSRPNAVFTAEIAAHLASKDTGFFRDAELFQELVTEIMPYRLKATNSGRLKILCAGGSTGQEAYSLAMMLEDDAPSSLKGAKIDIVSVDLCKETTAQAKLGRFGHYDVQKGLPIQRLLTHFKRLETGEWEISGDLRRRISFRQHNLMTDNSVLGKYDIILCRNLLPDLAKTYRSKLATSLSAQLVPGGMIMLGDGESFYGLTEALEPARGRPHVWVAAGTANALAA